MLRSLSTAALIPLFALACDTPSEADTSEGAGSSTDTESSTSADSGSSDTDTTSTESESESDSSSSSTDTGSDSGSESDSSESSSDSEESSAETDSEESGSEEFGETGMPDCADNDAWENNDLPENASDTPWDNTSEDDAHVHIDAHLCPGESDWYRLPVIDLEFDYYALHLDGIAVGSSWCGPDCGEPWLPEAAENGMTVEVYDAETLELLKAHTSESGRTYIYGYGDDYSDDLLIHLVGPTVEATYDYDLYLNLRGYDGEDECEC